MYVLFLSSSSLTTTTTTTSSSSSSSIKKKMVSGVGNNRLRKKFVSDFSYYFNNPELSDITISVVGDPLSGGLPTCSSPSALDMQSCKPVSITPSPIQDYGSNVVVESFHAHKFVLSARSPVFMRMLSSALIESKSSTIITHFPKETIYSVLKYLYTGKADLTPTTVLDILSSADYYSLEDLKDFCGWYSLRTCLEGDEEMDICKVLYAAEKFRMEKIKSLCFDYITQHSMDILLSSPNWHLLSEENVICILRQDSLRVPEVEIFDSLVRWAKKQYSILRDISFQEFDEMDFLKRKLQKPLQCIRFASMSPYQLSNHIEPTNLVDSEILFESYRCLATKQQPRRECLGRLRDGVQDFSFVTLGDTNGIMYYFGTFNGTQEFENPVARQLANVTSSTMSIGYPHPFTGRTPTNMYTDKLDNSHLTVELSNKYVLCPSYYSMRYAGDSQGSIYAAPKNWKLLGSLDGENWDCLKDHKEDISLKEGYSIAGWEVDSTHSYRHFRIQMTGPNQRDGNELCVCCFEIYGRLVKLEDDFDYLLNPTEENEQDPSNTIIQEERHDDEDDDENQNNQNQNNNNNNQNNEEMNDNQMDTDHQEEEE
ncbi:hypothetical protein DFA_01255 [Cavenderia fasciculata]|uniref:BTB domain-containing protein n=1 Tax=Cavenderia fasciculata TaxID=261658 RepID=F4PRT8_CACFS|nr:uncharacterized protein DFA_01255 [Cavenderia fasciculata]EGG21374.1 hypothetical protein DFA_01255 [Cavenderia fasciculata]|eukprot:XP_004359224.1 hypothetical protein DFA_01255 [Cavenderia fasciculata]